MKSIIYLTLTLATFCQQMASGSQEIPQYGGDEPSCLTDPTYREVQEALNPTFVISKPDEPKGIKRRIDYSILKGFKPEFRHSDQEIKDRKKITIKDEDSTPKPDQPKIRYIDILLELLIKHPDGLVLDEIAKEFWAIGMLKEDSNGRELSRKKVQDAILGALYSINKYSREFKIEKIKVLYKITGKYINKYKLVKSK